MFLLRRPAIRTIERFLSEQRGKPFSYSEVGATRTQLPAGYTIDHNRVCLGQGREVFEQARESLRRWRMFKLGWIELFRPETIIEVDATVAVLIHHFGFYSLNADRIVYVVNEERRFGFAYGTLPAHAEQGEERFLIETDTDGFVWYDILAFSRRRQWHVRLATPLARMLQKRFARDSMAAMQR
jgi:uncharacterized protein (UPF0548 family)